MTRLLIVRHGNTFTKEQTPTRVGARTDIPLVNSGKEQAKRLGQYLKAHQMVPQQIFVSPLKRSQETGRIAKEEMGIDCPIYEEEMFNEIDYGPDENQPEEVVIKRIGTEAIEAWNEKAVVPPGWKVDPLKIIEDWIRFGNLCQEKYAGQTILVVTSNGIARFSPCLTGDFEGFAREYPLKISTGAICIFETSQDKWKVSAWNVRP